MYLNALKFKLGSYKRNKMSSNSDFKYDFNAHEGILFLNFAIQDKLILTVIHKYKLFFKNVLL